MKILFIGAHADDIELSCGGTVAKYIDADHKLLLGFLSNCGVEGIETEFYNSCEVLFGSEPIDMTEQVDFERRQFPRDRQFILDHIIDVIKKFEPDLIFTHDPKDRHQDHAVVGEETIRAAGNIPILFYKSPFNTVCMDENYFVELNQDQLDRKIKALACYRSQKHRAYMQPAVIKANAIMRGLQCGKPYAEAFTVHKLVQ